MNSLCIKNRNFFRKKKDLNIEFVNYGKEATKEKFMEEKMNLIQAKVGEEYLVKEIILEDEELKAFLFSLGCYSGESITIISRLRSGCIVSIKEGRYSIDNDLARAIVV